MHSSVALIHVGSHSTRTNSPLVETTFLTPQMPLSWDWVRVIWHCDLLTCSARKRTVCSSCTFLSRVSCRSHFVIMALTILRLSSTCSKGPAPPSSSSSSDEEMHMDALCFGMTRPYTLRGQRGVWSKASAVGCVETHRRMGVGYATVNSVFLTPSPTNFSCRV